MKSILAAAIMLLTCDAAFAANGAPPLVTVRFNQRNVYYDKQLYNAISKAAQIKPEVTFDVVSGTGEANQAYAQQVVASMNKMGVPPSRISLSSDPEQNSAYPEVRVYVK